MNTLRLTICVVFILVLLAPSPRAFVLPNKLKGKRASLNPKLKPFVRMAGSRDARERFPGKRTFADTADQVEYSAEFGEKRSPADSMLEPGAYWY